MNPYFFCTLINALFISAFISCNNVQNEPENFVEEIVTDTLEVVQPVVEPELPDTIFASVESLVYDITVFDTTIQGNLNNIDDAYANSNNILCFRGSPFRDMPFYGKITGTPTDVTIDWTFATKYDNVVTSLGVWGGGTGWTGQPLYVEWPDSLMEQFRLKPELLTEDFDKKEVIVASLCGYLYFINYETGLASRNAIDVKNPIKGTPMIDPTFNGNIYIGQGVPRTRPWGALVVNMFDHEEKHFFAEDKNAWRKWGAYDSSPLIVGDFLIRCGENGTIYKFSKDGTSIGLHSTLRYKAKKSSGAGIESSMAVYKNYGYVGDNHGNVLCINLNNLQPVWYYNNHDDIDATAVLELEDGIPYVYFGCEVDRQGSIGTSYIVKLNGLNGELVWENRVACSKMYMGEKHFDGGVYSTPLLGKGNCENLIFTNICLNNPPASGDFMAIDRTTGETVYSTKLKHYAWSSPVAILNENDEMFVITFDTQGRVYIIEGATGEIILTQKIGQNFESSPIIMDNKVVIGSRGTKIYKLSIESEEITQPEE